MTAILRMCSKDPFMSVQHQFVVRFESTPSRSLQSLWSLQLRYLQKILFVLRQFSWYSPGWPRTYYINQTQTASACLCRPASASEEVGLEAQTSKPSKYRTFWAHSHFNSFQLRSHKPSRKSFLLSSSYWVILVTNSTQILLLKQ